MLASGIKQIIIRYSVVKLIELVIIVIKNLAIKHANWAKYFKGRSLKIKLRIDELNSNSLSQRQANKGFVELEIKIKGRKLITRLI